MGNHCRSHQRKWLGVSPGQFPLLRRSVARDILHCGVKKPRIMITVRLHNSFKNQHPYFLQETYPQAVSFAYKRTKKVQVRKKSSLQSVFIQMNYFENF